MSKAQYNTLAPTLSRFAVEGTPAPSTAKAGEGRGEGLQCSLDLAVRQNFFTVSFC
jgi:hypothetical protein